MGKLRGLVFFASWRLGWTILIWLFVLILIVLLFRCLRTLAEGIGVYLESALDHLGVPVSRCQTSREQDICRANRHLRAPSPSLRRISASRISPEPAISGDIPDGESHNVNYTTPTTPNWFERQENRRANEDLPPDYEHLPSTSITTNSNLQNTIHLTQGNIRNTTRIPIHALGTSQTNYNNDINSLDVSDIEAPVSCAVDVEEVEPPTYESLFPQGYSAEASTKDSESNPRN